MAPFQVAQELQVVQEQPKSLAEEIAGVFS